MKTVLIDGLGYVIPMNMLSYITGAASRARLPGPIRRAVHAGFVSTFGIDMSEAEHPLDVYQSIEDIFTRRLKPGARAIVGEPCSPADGILSIAAPAVNNSAIQAKGLTYSLSELMFGSEPLPQDFQFSYYATVYLAPHNYHRVHSPISGRLTQIRYFPGELWPVNRPSVRLTPRLFTRNERLVFELKCQEGTLLLAMIGALNVGRMTTPFLEDFASNEGRRLLAKRGPQTFKLPEPIEVRGGDELGTFMLGSTVILAFDDHLAKHFRLEQNWASRPVRMGEHLAEVT